MRLHEQMPELHGVTKWLNSEPLTKKELMHNKPILFHFWSVSCGLCKKAMPDVNKLRDAYEDDLYVIAVHMPRSRNDLDIEQIIAVAKEHGITQPIFVDSKQKLTNVFGNQYVPAYYLFDKDGKLRHFQSGGGGMGTLKKRVNRVLGKSTN